MIFLSLHLKNLKNAFKDIQVFHMAYLIFSQLNYTLLLVVYTSTSVHNVFLTYIYKQPRGRYN